MDARKRAYDPAIHPLKEALFPMDARVLSAFTRVFDALLPAHDGSKMARKPGRPPRVAYFSR